MLGWELKASRKMFGEGAVPLACFRLNKLTDCLLAKRLVFD